MALTQDAVSLLATPVKQGSRSRSTSAGSSGCFQAVAGVNSPEGLPAIDYPSPFMTLSSEPSFGDLDDMEYPSPVIIKNTFIDGPAEFSSLAGFFLERQVHSCPASALYASWEDASTTDEHASDTSPADTDELPEFEYPSPFAAGTLDDLPACTPPSSGIATPEPELEHEDRVPLQAPFPSYLLEAQTPVVETRLSALRARGAVLLQKLTVKMDSPAPPQGPGVPPPAAWAPVMGAPFMPPPPEQAPAVTNLQTPPPPPPAPLDTARRTSGLAAAGAQTMPQPELGSPELPTMGSAGHNIGTCKPCAFYHTRGCTNGLQCEFCHLCGPNERKKRAKQKQAAAMQEMKAARLAAQRALRHYARA